MNKASTYYKLNDHTSYGLFEGQDRPIKEDMCVDWCEDKNLPCIILYDGAKIYEVCYEQSKPTFEKKLGYKISKATWEKFRDGIYNVRR